MRREKNVEDIFRKATNILMKKIWGLNYFAKKIKGVKKVQKTFRGGDFFFRKNVWGKIF